TKKKQEETTKKQQPETTKKSPEETTRSSEKPPKNPAKEEEETTKFQAPFRYPDTETNLINEKNNPVITHMTVSQPFEIIKNILQNFGDNTAHGKENTEIGKNTETRSIIGNQSENGIKNGKSSKAGNYGQEGKGGNAAGGSTYRVVSLREKTAEFLNRKTPKVTKFMCKFILDITRVFVTTGK
ncbi:MAG: hypothetical protein K2N34_01050, partial [Lachnospiraceae bacterium]|nr:hypothetical protein [Lachnospiraceae bacterium]